MAMPQGRPRGSGNKPGQTPHSLGNSELFAPVKFPPAGDWLPQTKHTYALYKKAKGNRVLQPEDMPTVTRLMDYLDDQARLRIRFNIGREQQIDAKELQTGLAVLKSLEMIIASLSLSIGWGVRARQSLGVKVLDKPGSRLEAFLDDKSD